eukprot:m.86391 g.86391  ORF g.86391 m.86391 type:complete len:55 (-) comp8757_c4_seq1:592-756(-)
MVELGVVIWHNSFLLAQFVFDWSSPTPLSFLVETNYLHKIISINNFKTKTKKIE